MKSRIQEIIDQSSTMSWEVDHAVTTVDAYALAELVVKECAEFVVGTFFDFDGANTVEKKLYRHFGIKE